MLVAWDSLGEGHYLFLGSGVSLLLQMLEEEVVWGTLLLTVLGGGSAAGITSPACPASRPAEIMEQRLSNGHPGLLAPRSCGALSVCRLPGGAAALGRMAWERDVDRCRWLVPLPPPGATVETQRHPAKPVAPCWVVLQGGFPARVGQCWELVVLVKELLRGLP